MTALSAILMTCYIPGITGMAIATGWVVLSVSIPWIVKERILYWNPFLYYAIASVAWTLVFDQAIWDLWKLFILSGVFVLSGDFTRILVGSAIGLSVSTTLAAAQALGWTGLYATGNAGLFVNPNVFGELCAMVAAGLLAARLLWPLVLVLSGLVLSQGRAALLGLFVAIGAMAWQTSRIATIGVVLMGLAAILAIKPYGSGPTDERLAIWRDTLDGLTLFGRGPGSFLSTYPAFASRTDTSRTRPEDAHNDYLQLVFQYGIGAALLVPPILVGLLGSGPERYVFIAFAVIAFLNFPLAHPAEAFLGVAAMGNLWRRRLMVWAHFAPRGSHGTLRVAHG